MAAMKEDNQAIEDGGLKLDQKKSMFRKWDDNTQTTKQADESRLHRKYYHAKQWTDAEIAALKRRKQAPVVSNRIKRKVDFLVGMEQRQRTDPKAYPRNPGDEDKANVATKAIRFVCDNQNWPSFASDAMHNGLVSGTGGISIIVNPETNEIEFEALRPDEFFADPRAVNWDYSDARYYGLHKWVDIDAAKEMYANLESPMLDDSSDSDALVDEDKEKRWTDFEQRRVRLIEMYYKSGGVWRYTVFTGLQSLMDAPSTYMDEYGKPECPYRVWGPYVDEEGVHYGVIRDMKSQQDEINQRRSKLLANLSNRQTKGEKGAVDDVGKMKEELARHDGHVEINPGTDFDLLDNTLQTQGQAELLQEAKAEIENLGPNPGLIGRGVEQQSGRAILAQQSSGMTELSPVFERHRMWKLAVYRAVWVRIRQNWTAPRWLRVTEDERSVEFVPVNQVARDEQGRMLIEMTPGGRVQPVIENKLAELDMDIILDEGPDVITLQAEQMEFVSNMVNSGVPIEVAIELSSLPDKERLLDKIKGTSELTPEQIAEQQQQQQLQLRAMVAEVLKAEADVRETEANAAKLAAQAEQASADAGQKQVETIIGSYQAGLETPDQQLVS